MRIILHIGLHKTGTTAIQGFLARNAGALAERGIAYLLRREATINHHPLVIMFRKDKDHAAGRAAVAGILDRARGQGASIVLFSSEMLVEWTIDFKAFLSCFAGHEIEAIAYVRRPDELVASAHDQMVRDARQRRTAPVAVRPFAYDPAFRILPVWGKQELRLTIAPYDRKQWPEENLFADFLGMLGLRETEGFDVAAKPEEANVRLVPQLTEVLRLANQHPASEARHRELVNALYGLQNRFSDLLIAAPAMADDQRAAIVAALEAELPQLRPFFRAGFDEAFLHLAPAAAGATA